MTPSNGWGTGIIVVAAAAFALFAVASLTPGVAPAYAEDAPGQMVFMAQKCNTCHSVAAAGIEAKVQSEKMKGPDLSKVAADQDAEWLAKYVKKEADLDGKKHGKQFTGSDEELKALIDWLTKLAAQ